MMHAFGGLRLQFNRWLPIGTLLRHRDIVQINPRDLWRLINADERRRGCPTDSEGWE